VTTDPVPRGVVVAGMHRSGTSLVTGALHAAGWATAGELLPPGPANPRGYFEDLEILRIHERLLAAHGLLAWDEPGRVRGLRGQRLGIPRPIAADVDLIVARYRQGSPWVWKNPRATLFLHAWARLLPEATFVLPVRRPEEVVASLLRRGDPLGLRRRDTVRLAMRALSLWHSYNLAILDFLSTHEQRAVVTRTPQDLAAVAAAAPDAVDCSLLHRAPARLRVAVPRASQSLYRTLDQHAQPARLAHLLAGPRHRDATTP